MSARRGTHTALHSRSLFFVFVLCLSLCLPAASLTDTRSSGNHFSWCQLASGIDWKPWRLCILIDFTLNLLRVVIHQSFVVVLFCVCVFFNKCGWAEIPARGNKVSIKNPSCTTSPPVTHDYLPVWCSCLYFVCTVTGPSSIFLLMLVFIIGTFWHGWLWNRFLFATFSMPTVTVKSLIMDIFFFSYLIILFESVFCPLK